MEKNDEAQLTPEGDPKTNIKYIKRNNLEKKY